MKKPKVAIVYDRVNTPFGGAEQVLLALNSLYPDAPLFTAIYDSKKAKWANKFPKVVPSFLNKIPFFNKMHRWIPFLMPMAFEAFDFDEFDIVVSVTSAEAKGIVTKPHQLHFCYLLTPPRYLYQDREHSLNSKKIFKIPPIKWLASKLLDYLTWWDQQAILRPDVIIPISQRVGQRVREFYPKIKSDAVIYPPVKNIKVKKTKPEIELPESYILITSRLVSYKFIDQAILACADVNQGLVIVGDGPEKNTLNKLIRDINKKNIKLFSNLNFSDLQYLYQNCEALLMPGEEDFGIVALEANSYGKPVLINSKSGAAECIDHTIHGVHISKEKPEFIVKAIESMREIEFNKSRLHKNAEKYDTNRFIKVFEKAVDKFWNKKQKENL
jgi:glycosyltransferase involved in cell wall biosynthesis